MAESIPVQFGRYRVIRELGRGAMGVVYRAEDSSLGRSVAIKAILLSADSAERKEYEARFYQEAKAAGGLNHPNVVTIHDIGREGDVAYMAMELLDGIDLAQLMKQGALALPLALDLAAQAAEGLGFAHAAGVVHRDIKPANIMVVRGQQAKIMDFGIAKVRLSDVKTQTGSMLGTPKYMSPEQVAGLRTDHRSDIFSLGVTIYEMVTGTLPYQADDLGQLMYQIANVVPRQPSLAVPALPAMVDLILARALEKNPDARYQNATELAADLRSCRATLSREGAPAQRSGDSAAQPGTVYEKTVKLEAGSVPASAKADEASTKRTSQTVLVRADSMRLPVTRYLDSSQALDRMTALSAAGSADSAVTARLPTPKTGGIAWLHRLRVDPLLRGVLIAMLAAIVASVALVVAG